MNCVPMEKALLMFMCLVLLVLVVALALVLVVLAVLVVVAVKKEQRAVDSRAKIKFILGPRFFKKRIDSGMT